LHARGGEGEGEGARGRGEPEGGESGESVLAFSEAEESARVRTVADPASWRTREAGERGGGAGPGALSAVHVQRADSNHGGRVFFKKLEFR
jgi:hypothetical protein